MGVKEMWYVYMMEYYSAMKKEDVLPFATTWMNLEHIVLSGIQSHKERQVLHDITYMWNLKKFN